MANATDIARALKLRRSGREYTGPCPCCGYSKGFSVRDDHGRVLVRCHAGGCDQAAVTDALRTRGLWGGRNDAFAVRPVLEFHDPRKAWAAESADIARTFWRRSKPAEGTIVARYLHARGYDGPIPADLRFLPHTKHTETSTIWPAMIAAVRRSHGGELVAIHRTFIRTDGSGKADVEPDKKTLGPVSGGAVHLSAAGESLAVSEGVENGLTVLVATGVPTWAALSAAGLRSLLLPPLPFARTVTIAADHDAVGIAAAHKAAERWIREGRMVRIARPAEAGADFNDLLRSADAENPNDRELSAGFSR